jgi:hydrogenase/urease accessory protein HupE
VPGLDTNRDGTLSQSEIIAGRSAIEEFFVGGAVVHGAGSCTGALQDVALTEEDGVSIRASFHCPGQTNSVQLDLKFLEELSAGHRHLATATTGSSGMHVMAYAGNAEFQIGVATGSTWTGSVWPLFLLGIRHILTGYDHLLFLFGLILVGGRIRSLMVVITAFTIAHSITLGVAALQLWAPSTRFVEPAIALSIAYIGIENWFVKDVSRRWLITFPFGLIHGFGFAGALRQIALPHSEIPLALLSFNVGVEAGQLAVLAVVLPAIFWLRRRRWFVNPGVPALSGAIALAGVCWFLIRIS